MADEWLTIRLESDGDGINADVVVDALHTTIAILKEIDKERSRFGSVTIEWRISDAGKNSPFFAQITGRDTVEGNGRAAGVVADFAQGLKHLTDNNSCPSHFNKKSLSLVYDLAKAWPRGVNLIQFETPSAGEFSTTPDTARNAKRAISTLAMERTKRGRTYREFSTIEGRLKSITEISSQSRDQFTLVDDLTGDETTCYFAGSELEQQVRASWKHRVAVSGEITVQRDTGYRESMKVEEIRRLSERHELPNLQDIGPINITNGVESSEYVRGLRDAE